MRYLIGTYTRGTRSEGIYSTDLDLESGRLSEPRLLARSDNPSWLLQVGDQVLAVNEIDDAPAGGEVRVFSLEQEFLLQRDTVPSHGADPCHLACAGDRLAVANYGGGTVALYGWTGQKIGPLITLITPEAGGPTKRQATPHPHSACFLAGELWIPDLAGDRIYRHDPRDGALLAAIELPPGAGPRHLTRDGTYLVNELSNTVQKITDGVAEAPVSTLPDDCIDASSTAEIFRSGNRLYVSNRGHDSITVFETSPRLRVIQHQSTNGHHPRHFTVDPTGRWLLVANRDSDNIVCLPVITDGLLEQPISEVTCPSPVHLSRWDPGPY